MTAGPSPLANPKDEACSDRQRTCPTTLIRVYTCILLTYPVTGLSTEHCSYALGMNERKITDDQITASSHFDTEVTAHFARAHQDLGGGAWCPRNQVYNEGQEYLEINLVEPHVITKVEVQGRFGNGQGQEYAEQYKLQYWRPTIDHWVTYQDGKGIELLEGNTNTYIAKSSNLSPPVTATRLRFVPYSNHPRTVCMRVEIYGCLREDGLVSYNMHDGDMMDADDSLTDQSYDGVRMGNTLSGGLGQLTDGETGHTNFKVDAHGRERGYEWVGWKNISRTIGEPVEILFEFDDMRNFSAIEIHSNNLLTKDVQIFSRAIVFSSINEEEFLEVEDFSPNSNKISENARIVSIKLNEVVADRIKINLFFNLHWLMISEITFESVLCNCHKPVIVETVPPYIEETSTMQPKIEDKAPMVDDSDDNVNDIEVTPQKPVPKRNPALLIGCIITGIIFAVVPMFLIVMYYRNKTMKQRNKSHKKNGRLSGNKKVILNEDSGRLLRISGSILNAYDQSKNRMFGDLALTDEAATMYQEPFKGPSNSSGFYTLDCGTLSYEEPLDLGHDTEDSMDYAVPDVTLTSASGRGKYNSVPRFLPFVNAIMDIPPPPIPPPPEEPSHAPPPTDVQGVIGSAFCALPDSQVHKEDPSVVELFSYQINLLEVIGESNFGYAQLCELEPNKSSGRQTIDFLNNIYVVKKLKPQSCDITKDKFMKEIHILSQLHDENIARLVGVVAEKEGPEMVIQFTEYGDLYQFLRQHVTNDIFDLPDKSDIDDAKHLSRGALLHMATQIASGMKYLESKSIVHRDLATRNCLIGENLSIKISDLALCRSMYDEDYCSIEGRSLLPVRWMSPESLVHSLYTVKTDVWSFGVTLWELFTMARTKPFDDLNDSAAVEHICQASEEEDQTTLLPQPPVFGREMYQMMTSCWRSIDRQRPPFWEIHMFLKRKNMGYSVDYLE